MEVIDFGSGERFVSGEKLQEEKTEGSRANSSDGSWENILRPKKFENFPGQKKIVDKLKVYVTATLQREEPLDHVLFCGPPGLGKTTLSQIMAAELGVHCVTTSGPALDNKGKLAALLTSLTPNSIFFIDEIHRLNRTVEEYLYSAMEDFYIDLMTGEGLGATSMQFKLVPFTLVGATTRAGLVNAPLRDRFGIVERLSFYDRESLVKIVSRNAQILGMKIVEEGALEISRRSRGTPRIANRLLKRVRDYAQVKGDGTVDAEISEYALNEMEVDRLGLDPMDRKILKLIEEKFSGGPVGIDTISAALNEDRGTIEEVYEPYLIQEGLIQKTARGRVITQAARLHIEETTC